MQKALPEWAESLHNGYNGPPKSIQEMAQRFFEAMTSVTQVLTNALTSIAEIVQEHVIKPLVRWWRSPQVQHFFRVLRRTAQRQRVAKPPVRRRAVSVMSRTG
jgi:hypothetical protein